MDIFLFFLGLFFLVRKRYDWVLTIIIVLASTYLQLQFTKEYRVSTFLFEHNVSDVGLILYIIFFLQRIIDKGAFFKGNIQRIITVIFIFLILNGIYDYFQGTSIGDIFRYLRNWIYLSIIYIYRGIDSNYITKSLKQIYYLTLFVSFSLIVQDTTNLNIWNAVLRVGDISERGTKPPSYAIFCVSMALINVWNLSQWKRWLHVLILILPIVFSLKMTYAISIMSIYVIYLLIVSNKMLLTKLLTLFSFILILILFLNYNQRFTERLIFMTTEFNSAKNDNIEGNFSYRLLHASERYNYISKDPITYLRGLGYISEKNNSKDYFRVGLRDEFGDVIQFDTGDISWSIFFIRIGILGIALYIFIYFTIIKQYFNKFYFSKMNGYFLSMLLVFLFFTSLGNTIITESDFFIFPILFLHPHLLNTKS